MPNTGTRGAEVGEEEEDATGLGGPVLSELHTPKTRQSFARTRQSWRRRGKSIQCYYLDVLKVSKEVKLRIAPFTDAAERNSKGRAFRSLGAATSNAPSPFVFSRVRAITSIP